MSRSDLRALAQPSMRYPFCALLFICCLLPATQSAADEVADLIQLLKSDNARERYHAARSLGQLGAKAAPAIKPLVAALNDFANPKKWAFPNDFGPRVRDAVSKALKRIGKQAVGALSEALSDKDDGIRQRAAITLGDLGPLAKDSFAALARSLDDPEDYVRASVVGALGKIGAEPKDVVPLLVRSFQSDKTNFVRRAALEALHDADPDGTLAIPTLIEGRHDAVVGRSDIGSGFLQKVFCRKAVPFSC